MPTYLYTCQCDYATEIVKPLSELNRAENCPACAAEMSRRICAPAVRGDYAAYDCPITGKRIEGKRAHEENLRQHGCRVLEPGETAAVSKYRAREEAAFEAKIDADVEKTIHEMPVAKREKLIAEVESGLDVSIVRL